MRDGWRQVTLAEVSTRTIGRTPPRNRGEYWTPSLERPFVTITSMNQNGSITPAEGVTELAESEGKAKRIPAGSLLLSFKLSIGRTVVTDADCFPNEAIAWVRPDLAKLSRDYLRLALQVVPWADLGGRAVKGKTLNSASLDAVPIMLPPLRVQERIVDLIDTLDTTIQSAEAEAAALEVVTAKLRERHPDAPHVPVGDILNAIESGVSTKPVDGDGVEHWMLTLAALRPGRFDPAGIKSVGAAGLPRKVRVVDGDLLITRSNTPDRVGYVAIAREVGPETYFPDLVWRLRPIRERVSPVYLEQLLSSITFRARITALATGTSNSMRKINKANFSSLRIPVPTLTEQDDYARPILHAVQAERSAQTLLAHLRSLRLNLLTVLLSGEHEIPESYDELMEVAS